MFSDFSSAQLQPPPEHPGARRATKAGSAASTSSRGKARIDGTKYRMGQNQMRTRLELEAKYIDQWEEGRRMRKKPQQMETLLTHFNENPTWSMARKIQIAEEIGMTFHQVSKWNWDHRRKMGISTARKKKKE